MGYTYVTMQIAPLYNPQRRRRVRLLADTGAVYSVIPARVLKRLGIQPVAKRRLTVADGRVIERSYGNALFFWRGEEAASPVIFGEAKDPALLGVVTMEGFGVQVDPRTGKLKPMELLLVPLAPEGGTCR